jgi:histidinol phosphatase-like enzyme
MSFQLTNINPDWTLFLDRDGVINVEKKEDYIRNWETSLIELLLQPIKKVLVKD